MRALRLWAFLPIAALCAFGLAPPRAARADLVTHLPFDGSLFDEGPGGNDGAFFGDLDPTYVEGYDGTAEGAILFDGVDDYVLLTAISGIPITHAPEFTIAMWVKGPPGQSDRRIFSESADGGAPLFTIGTHNAGADGTLDGFVRSSEATHLNHAHSIATAFDDTWHHVAWVENQGDVTIYIDGIADTANFDHVVPPAERTYTTLGAIWRPNHTTPLGWHFTGAIDDVRLYDHALTAEEILALVPSGGCPEEGDTFCDALAVTGPAGGAPGTYTLEATDAEDLSGDAILYAFAADDGQGTVLTAGPQLEPTAQFLLTEGTWTLSVTVDDDLNCPDTSPNATCSRTIAVVCPAAGDTTLAGIEVEGPEGGGPGTYLVRAVGGADESGDPILYTYTASNGVDPPIVRGPAQDADTCLFTLGPGTWTLSAFVDDNIYCADEAAGARAETSLTVSAPARALVSRWRFDGDLEDAEASANDGEYLGAAGPNFAEGYDLLDPGAVTLNGADEVVRFAQRKGLPITAHPAYTVALWVKGPSGQADRRIFAEANSLASGATPHPFNLNPLFTIGTHNQGSDGTLDIYIRFDGGAAPVDHRRTAQTAFDDTWHHVAWVDDGGNARVYIDAVRDPTDFRYRRGPSTLDTTAVGGIVRAVTGSFFQGAIDDVRVYNYALERAEIEALVPERDGCPGDADTLCGDLAIDGPADRFPGTYTLTAIGASDASGDPLIYTFVAESSAGDYVQVGPGPADSVQMNLRAGTWRVSVKVDDDLRCRDDAAGATCAETLVIAEPPHELLSRWEFDGDLEDAGAAGNHGATVSGNPAPFGADRKDRAASALCLDGVSSDFVRVEIARDLPIHPLFKFSGYTIAMWVKGLPQPDRRVYSESSSSGANALFTIGTQNLGQTGQADIFIRDDAGGMIVNHRYSTATVFDGAWHHIAWVDSSGDARMYVDGVLDATDFRYAKRAFPLDIATIGGIYRPTAATPASHPFAGCIDDVRVYTYALTADQVRTVFEGGEIEDRAKFRRGDSNADGGCNITDGIFTLNFLFLGGPEPPCSEAADANNDGGLNITDGIYVLNYLFLGGPEPPPPGPTDCGVDPDPAGSPGDIGCASYTKC